MQLRGLFASSIRAVQVALTCTIITLQGCVSGPFGTTASGLSADTGWLGGVQTGDATLQDFRFTTTTARDNDTVMNVFGGYRPIKNYAVNLGYTDFGKYRFSGPDFGGYVTNIEIKGIHLQNVGILPIAPRTALLGTIGLFRWTYEERDIDVPTGGERHLKDTGNSLTYGIGANYEVFKVPGASAGLHLGWQRFKDVGHRIKVEHINDFNVLTGGASYQWGR